MKVLFAGFEPKSANENSPSWDWISGATEFATENCSVEALQLPNFVFYQLMRWLAAKRSMLVGGLIQVPEASLRSSAPEQVQASFVSCILDGLRRSGNEAERLSINVDRLRSLKGSPRP